MVDRSCRRWNWRRGLNLAEVMLALGILAVAMLALIGVFTSGLRLLAQSRDAQTATQLARQLLEQVRVSGNVPHAALTFDGSIPTAQVAGFPPAPYPAATVANLPFTLVVTTQPIRPDFVAVRVVVRWHQHQVMTESCFYAP